MGSEDDIEEGTPKGDDVRVVTTFKLVGIAFFMTCGGPYGFEETVNAAGPLLTLLGLSLLPFMYALPQALITAELGCIMDENGGYVVWVERAFGDFWGWFNSHNSMLANFFDNALFPVIFVDYVNQMYHLTYWEAWGLKLVIILVIVLLNLRGIDMVSWVSALLTCAILIPLALELIFRFKHINPAEQWTQVPHDIFDRKEVDWGLFLSTALWLYAGWDGLGTIAGEVKNPATTFPRGIILALILCSGVFLLPVIIGLSVSTKRSDWTTGFFVDIARHIHPWLGYWVLVGAMLTNFGLFNGGLAASSRAMWAMGEFGHLPKPFNWTWERYNTPWVSIVFSGFVTVFLVSFDFKFLVQIDVFLDVLTLVLEFGAFLWMRYKEPDTDRPFKIPGGMIGAWLVVIPKVIVIGVTLALANWTTLIVAGGVCIIIIVAYYVKMLIVKKYINPRLEAKRASSKPDETALLLDDDKKKLSKRYMETPQSVIDSYHNDHQGNASEEATNPSSIQ
jgi:amino acid transporter